MYYKSTSEYKNSESPTQNYFLKEAGYLQPIRRENTILNLLRPSQLITKKRSCKTTDSSKDFLSR